MVVRSAQKGRDDIQKIRDAMEGGRPVVSDFLRELIVKQADMIGEDGKAMVEDIEDAAVCTNPKLLPADIFKMIEGCVASLEQKVQRVPSKWKGTQRGSKGEPARGARGISPCIYVTVLYVPRND